MIRTRADMLAPLSDDRSIGKVLDALDPATTSLSGQAAAPSSPSSLPPVDGAADTLCPPPNPPPRAADEAPATPDSNGMRPGVVWGFLQAAYMAEAIAYETDFPLSQSGRADNWKE